MRILGGWIALTPEVDAKLLFDRIPVRIEFRGRHPVNAARRLPLFETVGGRAE